MRQKPVGSENIRHDHVEEINLIHTCQISAPESKYSPQEADVRPPRLRGARKKSKKNDFLGSQRTRAALPVTRERVNVALNSGFSSGGNKVKKDVVVANSIGPKGTIRETHQS